MIPNHAPLAAVYVVDGTNDSVLFSLPVTAWSPSGTPLVPGDHDKLVSARNAAKGARLVGLWVSGWAPSLEEMAVFLTSRT